MALLSNKARQQKKAGVLKMRISPGNFLTILMSMGLCILVMPGNAMAQTSVITLKNGTRIEGMTLRQNEQTLFLDLGYEIMELPQGEISAIEEAVENTEDEALAELANGSEGSWKDISARAAMDRTRYNAPQLLERARKGVVIVTTPGGWGSGFVIDRRGHIITNQHVVHDEKYVSVTMILGNGKGEAERKKIDKVQLVALSPLHDIALLRLPEEVLEEVELHPLPLASPRSLSEGSPVYAIGNPGMGRKMLEHTLSEGIVSSAARNFSDVLYIQTTAPVNPGNSGGPMINAYGEVVGLVSMRAIFQEGIAFALPIDYLRFFLNHREAFAYGENNPNTGYHYLSPQDSAGAGAEDDTGSPE